MPRLALVVFYSARAKLCSDSNDLPPVVAEKSQLAIRALEIDHSNESHRIFRTNPVSFTPGFSQVKCARLKVWKPFKRFPFS